MNKICLLLMSILFSNAVCSQAIDNNLHGHYQAKTDATIYSYFEFDGNGKVDITGMGTRDYFTKGDSLIIYPDKGIFKFKIKKNTLIGASNWVDNQTWVLKDTVVPNNRKNETSAKKAAALLHEYYTLTDKKSQFDFMQNDEAAKSKTEKINKLCNEGLSKACMDYFGIMLIEDQGLNEILNPKENSKPKKANPQIIALGKKIIAQGEVEGYTLLGSYYFILGQKKMAEEQWNTGADKGSQKSAIALIQIESE